MSLLANDLSGTVLPRISVDEFSPKSGDNRSVIVVAFYTIDKEPANDLNRFIQRGSVKHIDAEVSPNPDEDGNYVLFVEMERNAEFKVEFYKLITDVENVAGNLKWQVKAYLSADPLPYNDPSLFKYIVLEPKSYKEKHNMNVHEQAVQFFNNVGDVQMEINESQVTFENQLTANVVAAGNESLYTKYNLSEGRHYVLDEPKEIRRLRDCLGRGIDVIKIDENVVLFNYSDNSVAILHNLIFKV